MLDVHIKNYQSLKDVKLSFKKGINIITGKTNSGKSAIYRAIMAACFNIPNESHVRLGSTKASVKLSNEHGSIEWERDLNKSSQVSYIIDGVTYAKTGGKPLQEVSDILGLGKLDIDGMPINLNFHLQMAYPFLLSNSPAQLYKVFTQTGNKYDFLEILSKIKSDTQDIKDTHTTEQKFRDKLQLDFLGKKDILDRVQSTISVVDDIVSLEPSVVKYNKLVSFIGDSLSLDHKRSVFSVILSDIEKLSTLQGMYSQYVAYDDLLVLSDRIDKYRSVISALSNLVSLASHLCVLIKRYLYFLLYIGLSQLESLRSCYLKLELLDVYDRKFTLESSICALNAELDEIGICPTCNQPLNGIKIEI